MALWSPSGLTLLCGLAVGMWLGGFGLVLERWHRRAGIQRELGKLSLEKVELGMPNYRHIWFAHDILLVNGRSGALCDFGEDYVSVGGDWAALCVMDSDGDGLTNGEELGDPCCTWRADARPSAFGLNHHLEYRRWHLSHPGRPLLHDSPSQLEDFPFGCANYSTEIYARQFRSFYFYKAWDDFEPVGMKPLKVICGLLMCAFFGHWIRNKGLMLDCLPFAFEGAALSCRTSAIVMVASYVYMDMTSGIIHLILDYAPHWLPGLGSLARGFQYHHQDPTAIIRISWYEYASHIHVLVPVIATIAQLSDASPAQRLFWAWGGIFAHVFQTAHRWAHMPPEWLPGWVLMAQRWGLLLTTEKHMLHHQDLEQQFTILSGVTDVFMDWISRWIRPARYDLWLLIGIVWFMLPTTLDLYFRKFVLGLENAGASQAKARPNAVTPAEALAKASSLSAAAPAMRRSRTSGCEEAYEV